jgi:hypothetical protein
VQIKSLEIVRVHKLKMPETKATGPHAASPFNDALWIVVMTTSSGARELRVEMMMNELPDDCRRCE